MPPSLPNPRELGYLYTLAQVGLEMVVPIGLGAWLENQFDFRPWGVVVGAVLGLVVGLTHLVMISNRQNPPQTGKPSRDDS
jgi:F0F1-type ATP synthase assembly protein I